MNIYTIHASKHYSYFFSLQIFEVQYFSYLTDSIKHSHFKAMPEETEAKKKKTVGRKAFHPPIGVQQENV
jgi:hypothetical protein